MGGDSRAFRLIRAWRKRWACSSLDASTASRRSELLLCPHAGPRLGCRGKTHSVVESRPSPSRWHPQQARRWPVGMRKGSRDQGSYLVNKLVQSVQYAGDITRKREAPTPQSRLPAPIPQSPIPGLQPPQSPIPGPSRLPRAPDPSAARRDPDSHAKSGPSAEISAEFFFALATLL